MEQIVRRGVRSRHRLWGCKQNTTSTRISRWGHGWKHQEKRTNRANSPYTTEHHREPQTQQFNDTHTHWHTLSPHTRGKQPTGENGGKRIKQDRKTQCEKFWNSSLVVEEEWIGRDGRICDADWTRGKSGYFDRRDGRGERERKKGNKERQCEELVTDHAWSIEFVSWMRMGAKSWSQGGLPSTDPVNQVTVSYMDWKGSKEDGSTIQSLSSILSHFFSFFMSKRERGRGKKEISLKATLQDTHPFQHLFVVLQYHVNDGSRKLLTLMVTSAREKMQYIKERTWLRVIIVRFCNVHLLSSIRFSTRRPRLPRTHALMHWDRSG